MFSALPSRPQGPSAPKAVVFDLGKVLVDFDYGRAAAALASQSSRGAAEIHRVIDQSPWLFEYETGLLTTAQFRDQMSAAIGFTGTATEFATAFTRIFTPLTGMIALHEELVRRGVPTFAFSNTHELAIQFIRRTYPFYRAFSDAILSYEEGAMKPVERLYAVVEQRSWHRGADLLFIDDRLENVETAARRGWRTIHHTDEAATIAQVREAVGRGQ